MATEMGPFQVSTCEASQCRRSTEVWVVRHTLAPAVSVGHARGAHTKAWLV